MNNKKKISIVNSDEAISYPTSEFLFRPSKAYPEYPFKDCISPEKNMVYDLVRNSMVQYGLDSEHVDLPEWNPLGKYIIPGNAVLVKPNLVQEEDEVHKHRECLYVNPAVIAAIIDYTCIALKGTGRIILADAPMQSCNFDKLIKQSGYDKLIKFYQSKGIKIELRDLRGVRSEINNNMPKWETDKSRIESSFVFDLAEHSFFYDLDNSQIDKMRITNYPTADLKSYHSNRTHKYVIAKEANDADVIINVCKPKMHRKAGVTISMKNFIGTIVCKQCLPHHRNGSIAQGGDEYNKSSVPLAVRDHFLDYKNDVLIKNHRIIGKCFDNLARICSFLSRMCDKSNSVVREGAWYGNDTLWRTVLDINGILHNSYSSPSLNKSRCIICFADMVYVGEKEGPLHPSPRYCGSVAFGDNVLAFDEAVATIMGVDINKIPIIHNARVYSERLFRESFETVILSNKSEWNNVLCKNIKRKDTLALQPASGWKGHCELEE